MTQLRALVNKTYCLGCAMNFLFNLTRTYHDILVGSELVSRSAFDASAGFIAIHLRFGDEPMMGKTDDPHEREVKSAVTCASLLGERVFKGRRNWSIFISSDSHETKTFALKFKTNVIVYAMPPVHSETWRSRPFQRGRKYFVNSLLDHVMLSRAKGFVGCQWKGHCRLSSYSELAIQEFFLPVQHAWSLTGQASCGCRPAYPCQEVPPSLMRKRLLLLSR